MALLWDNLFSSFSASGELWLTYKIHLFIFFLAMIELLYLASQIQCGVGGDFLNIQVDVYNGTELVQTMSVDDRVMVPVTSVSDLTFEYNIVGNTTNCTSLAAPSALSLDNDSVLPTVNGFDQQESVQTMLADLDDYEELFLVELGTTSQSSSAYDLQDVVFRVDNNPAVASFYPD